MQEQLCIVPWRLCRPWQVPQVWLWLVKEEKGWWRW
jgi:hypothetical protein